jgi:hypothetical protein
MVNLELRADYLYKICIGNFFTISTFFFPGKKFKKQIFDEKYIFWWNIFFFKTSKF